MAINFFDLQIPCFKKNPRTEKKRETENEICSREGERKWAESEPKTGAKSIEQTTSARQEKEGKRFLRKRWNNFIFTRLKKHEND